MRAIGWWLVLFPWLVGGCTGTKTVQRERAAAASASEQVLEVVPLEYAQAELVAEELGESEAKPASAGGLEPKVMVDPRTNSLILQGPRGWVEKQKKRIAELDQPPKSVEVVPLKHAAAAEMASTLSELREASRRPVFSWCALPKPGKEDEVYRSDWNLEWPPWIVVADPRTNSLVVSCSDPADLPRVLELIARLDVEATSSH